MSVNMTCTSTEFVQNFSLHTENYRPGDCAKLHSYV